MSLFSFTRILDFESSKGRNLTFRLLLPALFLYCFAPYQQTIAYTTNGNLAVTAMVSSHCIVQNGSLGFGTYDPIQVNADQSLQGVGHLDIRCLKNSSAELQLSNGSHAGNAGSTSRAMANADGSNFLSYEIYTSQSLNTVWNSANTISYTATDSNPVTIDVYGKIPANQLVEPGAYSDTVTITANF